MRDYYRASARDAPQQVVIGDGRRVPTERWSLAMLEAKSNGQTVTLTWPSSAWAKNPARLLLSATGSREDG